MGEYVSRAKYTEIQLPPTFVIVTLDANCK